MTRCWSIVMLVAVWVLIPFGHSHAQEIVYSSFDYGTYFHNSDNGTKVLNDRTVREIVGFNVGYVHQLTDEYALQFEVGYSESFLNDVLQFVTTGSGGPQMVSYFYSDYRIREYKVETSFLLRLNGWLAFGGGPSFSIVNRSILIDEFGFEDRLASAGLGLHAKIRVALPFTSDEPTGFMAFIGLKASYTDPIWFDKRGRKLDGFKQTLLRGIGSVGVGYRF